MVPLPLGKEKEAEKRGGEDRRFWHWCDGGGRGEGRRGWDSPTRTPQEELPRQRANPKTCFFSRHVLLGRKGGRERPLLPGQPGSRPPRRRKERGGREKGIINKTISEEPLILQGGGREGATAEGLLLRSTVYRQWWRGGRRRRAPFSLFSLLFSLLRPLLFFLGATSSSSSPSTFLKDLKFFGWRWRYHLSLLPSFPLSLSLSPPSLLRH